MFKSSIVVAFLSAGLFAACSGDGGTSGGSGGKLLTSLTGGEITDLCVYLIEVAGPEREIDCADGFTTTVGGGSVSECVAGISATPVGCTVTVTTAETCAEDLAFSTDAQVCSGRLPASCMVWFGRGCR